MTYSTKNSLKLLTVAVVVCGTFFLYLGLPEGIWQDPDDTRWEYSDCGRVVFVDRTTSKEASGISYYVTYASEYYQENRTIKVTPAAYQSAQDCKLNNRDICFGITSGMHFAYSLLWLLCWGIFITSAILLFVWGKRLFIDGDTKPEPKSYGGYY